MKRRARQQLSQPTRLVNNLFGALGVAIFLLSATFLVVFVGELISGNPNERGVALAMVVFFLGTALAGAVLAHKCFQKPPPHPVLSDFEREQRVLDLAKKAGGRLTLPEVAADCDLSLEDSKRLLEHFVVQGVAECLVTDDGILVYRFPGFLSPEKKARARDF